ncbi:MAG: M14 family metallopeptidase [Bacillota bacterium]
MELSFDRYYDYEELTAALKALAHDYPKLGSLSSLGQSPEGRELWLFTLTGPGKPHGSKPGYCIDANHHAGEVTGSMVTLYTIWYLLTNYGKDEAVTRLVDRITFYFVPRLAVDGAEVYLKTPETLRSAPRYYPHPHPEEKEGLYPHDVDGNGHILLMRVSDPAGEWKSSHRDPRMMVRRAPDEEEGTFYRLFVEGMIRDWDGGEVKAAPPKWGLDFNRNYPVEWRPEYQQRGAGRYPLSEPETRILADFILAHPNIGGSVTYHTSGGVILHPPGTREPSALPQGDLEILKTIGQLGTEATGYPCVPILGGFTTDKENIAAGAFDDWMYEHLGIPSYTVELWAIAQRAGLENIWPRRAKSLQEQEDELHRILQWNDRELAGKGFVPWTPFEHPQLGPVDIGGWLPKFVVQNPPPHLLLAECHKNMIFTLRHARALPRLELANTRIESLGDGTYRIETTVSNTGYLATYLTRQGLERKSARPVVVELTGEGFDVVSGKSRVECGHLEGRSARAGGFFMAYYFAAPAGPSQKQLAWVIQARGEGPLRLAIKATSGKAGEAYAELAV